MGAITERKAELIELSKMAKKVLEVNQDYSTVNEVLTELFYKDNNPDITEFKTFQQWKDEGKKIVKGSRAYMVWGKPRKAKKQKQEPETTEAETIENEYKFYPTCNLFSNLQVQ